MWKVVGGNGAPRHILLPTTGGPHRGLQIKDVETSASGYVLEESEGAKKREGGRDVRGRRGGETWEIWEQNN